MLAFFAPTMATAPVATATAPVATALAAALMALVAPIAIARLHHYRWRDIEEELGKWVHSWRGIIVIVTIRVIGVASHIAIIVAKLSESWTGSKTVVSYPGPARQNEG
jgi:hypothetical protein